MDVKKIQAWLSGEQLRSEFFRKQYKLIILIAGLLFIYILAGYNSMKQQRRLSDLKREVKTAKFEYLTISAQLAEQTRQSKVYERLKASNVECAPEGLVGNVEKEEGRRKKGEGQKLEENRRPVIQISRHR